MPQSRLKNTLSPEVLITSGIFTFVIFILSSLTKSSLTLALCSLIPAYVGVWIYTQVFKSNQSDINPILNLKDIRRNALEELSDTLPRAIVVLDKSSKVISANSTAYTMLSHDIIGQPIGTYLRDDAVRPHMDKAFEGEMPPSLSVQLSHPTERYIDVDFSRAILIDPDDPESAVVLAVLADRTQSHTQRELRADFLANASHELKTPIASMKGFIETLRGHAKNDPIAREKFLKIMAEQAERMERLVTDLLSLRRIESAEHLPPSESADLRKALDAAQDSLTLLAEDKGVTMRIRLAEKGTAYTLGKTDECTQLFLNLMENGIKLSPKDSTLNVSLEHLPHWNGQAFNAPNEDEAGFRQIVNLAPTDEPVWRVIITDEGPGISQTHLPRIGERFYRVAGDLPAQEKGTGLGLAIVKHIAVRHRAGLFVKTSHADETDNRSHGTSFCVIFAAPDPNDFHELAHPKLG